MIPWTTAFQPSLSTISQSFLKLMSIEFFIHRLTISSSVTPFSSCPPSYPASGSFPSRVLDVALCVTRGFLNGSSSNEPACQCRRHRFNPWVRKIPWRKRWQPTQVFLPGKPHGQRSLAGYSPWGCKESDTTEHTHTEM